MWKHKIWIVFRCCSKCHIYFPWNLYFSWGTFHKCCNALGGYKHRNIDIFLFMIILNFLSFIHKLTSFHMPVLLMILHPHLLQILQTLLLLLLILLICFFPAPTPTPTPSPSPSPSPSPLPSHPDPDPHLNLPLYSWTNIIPGLRILGLRGLMNIKCV